MLMKNTDVKFRLPMFKCWFRHYVRLSKVSQFSMHWFCYLKIPRTGAVTQWYNTCLVCMRGLGIFSIANNDNKNEFHCMGLF